MGVIKGGAAATPAWAGPLWRAILRTASHFDSDRTRRLVLNAPLLRAQQQALAERPLEETANALAETAVERAVEHLRHSQTTRHSAAVDLTTSPQTLVSALSQQLKLSRDQAVDGGTLGDAGFSLLRSLHAADEQAEALILPRPCATAQPISLAGHGGAASAALSASSPTSVAQVLTGDYLAFDPMAYPARCLESVYALTPMLMLVLEAPHEDRPAIGLVVNAPTRLQLRSSHWMHALECPDGGVFQCCPVFYGGPDELRSITMLHPHGEQLPGSRRVTRTLWTGGYLSDAAQLVRTRRAQPSDFLFFRGRHEWRTGEMERQLAEGELIGPVRSMLARPPDATSSQYPTMHATSSSIVDDDDDDDDDTADWARPSRRRAAALSTEDRRLSLSWRAWAAHIKRCGPAFAPLQRLRKDKLRDHIVSAAHSVRSVGRPGSGEPITEQPAEQRGSERY